MTVQGFSQKSCINNNVMNLQNKKNKKTKERQSYERDLFNENGNLFEKVGF